MMVQHFGGNIQLLNSHHDDLKDSENIDGNINPSDRSKGCTACFTLLRNDEFKEYQTLSVLEN